MSEESEPEAPPTTPDATASEAESGRAVRLRLLALSFTALFLELMLIRWAPATVRVVSYYANLLLISSFLGLGLGAMASGRELRLFRWFPLLLLALVGLLTTFSSVRIPGTAGEYRFYGGAPEQHAYLVLGGIFLLNTTTFVALGERIGQLFRQLPALSAYAWDLGGSLLGTLSFGLFSLLSFSPTFGFAFVGVLYLAIERGHRRLWAAPVLLAVVLVQGQATEPAATWSPYYYITVHDADGQIVTEPAEDLRELEDPPIYTVHVNHDFYQDHGAVDPGRYDDGLHAKHRHRLLMYEFVPEPKEVLVLGAGGGADVEAALLSGAERVVAVEIDPGIVRLGRRFNASGVYDDERVEVINDDARAYLQRSERQFDVVVFGLLDSQALFSSMSNIRLDGFVYTVDGLRAAYERVRPGGVMLLAFAIGGQGWLAHKLVEMIRTATGREPVVFGDGVYFLFAAHKGEIHKPRARRGYRDLSGIRKVEVDLATDDWPYLYLREKGVPRDYKIVIGGLFLICVLGWLLARGRSVSWTDGHFFFLGAGFLLLETKSIVACSLYFGATWLVTNLVILGVLLMVLGSNAIVQRWPDQRPRKLYLLLAASLAIVLAVPEHDVLAWSFTGRVLWTVLVVPLPILFAGVIFSSQLRTVDRPEVLFGANLVGATVGGLTEYVGMAIGHSGLELLIVLAYAASAVSLARSRRAG